MPTWRLLLAVGSCLLTATWMAFAGPKTNVILILCDDMGWSDIGCYGGEIQTPHLDRLAAEGLRFTQFYNAAKCTTTRAALLTGLYPRQKDGPLLKSSMVTLGEALQKAGYQTALSGKWHLGAAEPRRPIDRGFQSYYGLMDGCCDYFNPAKPDPEFKGRRIRSFAHQDETVTEFPPDYYTTDAFTDHAITQMEHMASKEAPFFLHLCYTAPHYPLHAPEEDIQKYVGQYREGWEALRRSRHQRQVRLGLIDAGWKLPPADPEAGPWKDQTHPEWQDRRMAVYAAMIDRMDQGIGRLMDAVDRLGIREHTMILFLSDNGGCSEVYGHDRSDIQPGSPDYYTTCGPGWAFAQNTPFRRFKTWMHEGGISTPLIVRWPAVIAPNSMTRQVGHIIDVMPTLLEAGGAAYPDIHAGHPIIPVEGKSLIPVFEGREREGHDVLCWEYRDNRAVREGDWKLVWDRKVKAWELYHLAHDRTEMTDLASQYPERVRKMIESWEHWAARTGVLNP